MQQRRAVPWILSGTLCCTAGWAQDPPPAEVKPIVKDAVRRDRIEDRRDRREDIRDRREDVRDRKEDIRDRMEDVRDARDDARKKEALGDIDRRIRALKAEGGHPELVATLQKRRAHLVRKTSAATAARTCAIVRKTCVIAARIGKSTGATFAKPSECVPEASCNGERLVA